MSQGIIENIRAISLQLMEFNSWYGQRKWQSKKQRNKDKNKTKQDWKELCEVEVSRQPDHDHLTGNVICGQPILGMSC